MKIRLSRHEFAEALTWLSSALPRRPTMPVLAGIHITAANGAVTLRACDFEVFHTAVITADVGDEGTALVSGVRLRDLVVNAQSAVVDLDLAGSLLHLSTGRSSYKLRTMAADEYPDAPPAPADNIGTAKGADLLDILNAVAHAASDDESTLGSLRGVVIEAAGGRIIAAASDRYQLGYAEAAYSGPDFVAQPLHGQATAAVRHLTGDAVVSHNGNNLTISDDTHTSVLRTSAEPPFAYRRIMRDQHDISITADPGEITDALRRLAVVTEPMKPITLDFNDKGLTLTAADSDNASGVEYVDATVPEDVTTHVSGERLTKLLACMPSGPVAFGLMSTGWKPLVLTPADDVHPTQSHVLMPIKLK